ncbi:outer membrane protein assembly factor BamD [Haloferula sp. BvORR071]|uniref:tetratricopeptide repeat protein n=1 Tax=Haloferula sp. BvORR071 TaxID=1396141 RepID=UPI00054F44B3|nr:outer membrane protein assembly factor BamD [Haloferula sp. BvORR071]
MRFRFLVVPALAAFLASCGGDSDAPPLIGTVGANNELAGSLYSQAQQAEKDGKRSKAIKLYDKLADEMPTSEHAAEARFRQGELLEQDGEIQKSFVAYQDFITRYNNSNLYEKALSRQAAMAQSAADGHVKTSFLGLKSSISNDKITDMLAKVRANAPRSPTASKAQFTIGEVWEIQGNASGATKAVAAYRELVVQYPDSKEAPEAQFRIGKVLLDQAKHGNQDQANLDRAKVALEDYVRQYPSHHRVGEARKMIANIGGQDVERSFEIAQFYERKGDVGSAKFYYQEVLRQSAYGPTHDKAKKRLAELGN